VLWLPRNLPDELMIAGIYVVMGIVMIAAAPDPGKHKAFIDFVILANLLHAAIRQPRGTSCKSSLTSYRLGR
jgi:hypothetical protein